MNDLSTVGLVAAIAAGAISFASPCVLPLVPGYVSYIAGRRPGDSRSASDRWVAFGTSLCFVLGFSTVFVILGASATALGRSLLRWRYELNQLGGGIVVMFGLFTIGMARFPLLEREFRFHFDVPGGSAASAYILGLAFGFGWTPCIGPILGAILTASAATASLSEGVALLAAYAAGLGVPFLIVAAFTDRLKGRLRRAGGVGRRLHQAAGAVMVLMGIAMITGQLSTLSYWLLETFPAFGKIG